MQKCDYLGQGGHIDKVTITRRVSADMEWWIIAFIKIMLINIILSGDNAIVIAMASRNLPKHQRKIAVFWGAFGAIALRILLTLVAIQLLRIPFLTAAGGLLLVWVALKLMTHEENHSDIQATAYLGNVVMTIIIADFVMSLDNVIAITAVAKGDMLLITIGLILSIPLIIWGSGIILRVLERFPAFIYLGAAILGFTAGEMFVADKKVIELLYYPSQALFGLIPIMFAFGVVIFGLMHERTLQ
jgi:YjbE family integral membrane protein